MTRAQIVKTFRTLEELLDAISTDTTSSGIAERRYPVRFILLDNFDKFRGLIAGLRQRGVQSVELETLACGDACDDMITKDALMSQVKTAGDKTIVSPVSEVIRFYDETRLKAFLEELALLEMAGDKSRRIYIPLIGLAHRFNNFLDGFYRIQEIPAVWHLACEQTHAIKLYLLPSDFPVPASVPCLKTFYDWLYFWRHNAPRNKVLSTSDCLNYFYSKAQPDNIFEIEQLRNGKSFVVEYMEFDVEIDYRPDEEIYWRNLSGEIVTQESGSFRELVHAIFNSRRITTDDLLKKWLAGSTSPFHRWLLKHYYLIYCGGENAYLTGILEDLRPSANPLALIEKIALAIFHGEQITKAQVVQRKLLIDAIGNKWLLPHSVEIELNKYLSEIARSDMHLTVTLCTGQGQLERESIIRWFAEGKLTLEMLREVYADLADYLGEFTPDLIIPNTLASYFSSYRTAKLRDEYAKDIATTIAGLNKDEQSFWNWYHQFSTTENLLASTSVDKVYWLDGVGAEYLPLIVALIRQSMEFQVEKAEIATVMLPTATEFNRPPRPHEKQPGLDTFIHSEPYKYPSAIVREIEIVCEMIRKICQQQTAPTTIALVSDHGLTALSRLADPRNYGWEGMSHEGRYAEFASSGGIKSDSDYLVKDNGDKRYRIALTHSSLGTKPIREAHGGCTPEEVLVPFVIISNKRTKVTSIDPTGSVTPKEAILQKPEKPTPGEKNKAFAEEEMF